MTKKIKFPLEMNKGVQVRTIGELKENFDVEKILEYFVDGKLQTWLEDRYYEEEAEKISALSISDKELKSHLASVFGIEYYSSEIIDVKVIESRNKKSKLLRQVCNEEEILRNIDSVVFNQEELNDIMLTKPDKVYLFDGVYTIDTNICYITYSGIGDVTVSLKGDGYIDLDGDRIVFKNVKLSSDMEISINANLSTDITICDNILQKIEWIVYAEKRIVRLEELLNDQNINFMDYVNSASWVKVPQKNDPCEITSIYKKDKNSNRDEELISGLDNVFTMEYNNDYVVYATYTGWYSESTKAIIKSINLKDNNIIGAHIVGKYWNLAANLTITDYGIYWRHYESGDTSFEGTLLDL
jgi:hypothetical protein